MRRLVLAGALAFSVRLANAGTLDDMELRSNVETLIRGTAQTAQLHLKIEVEQGVAIPVGDVANLNQADEVATLAAKVKGITAVDRSRFRFTFTQLPDDELASHVTRTLFELPRYAASSLKIAVDQGVVTLSGGIKNAAWRGEIRRVCGGIDGVIEVVDHIETPETPADKVQKALNAVFGPRVVPRFPGRVEAAVRDGVVTLEGRVPRLCDKQAAEHNAWGINGVRRVDNRLMLGSGTAIQVIHP